MLLLIFDVAYSAEADDLYRKSVIDPLLSFANSENYDSFLIQSGLQSAIHQEPSDKEESARRALFFIEIGLEKGASVLDA